jgi:hypothetical protein
MSATRMAIAIAGVVIALGSAAWLTVRRGDAAPMVRVGGAMNACTCTQRIEP